MADRRCFTKKITESDSFLEMPLSTQCLYFHLNMNADDDGFVNSPKKIMRIVGASEDDLKILMAKKFVIVFESGIIVIKHWRMHNTLQNDRYHPTDYQEEFKQLSLKSNKAYTLGNGMDTKCIQNVSNVETEHNITKLNETKQSNSRFTPPTLDEIKSYIQEKNLGVDAQQFFDYFTEGNWKDAKGNKVKNWKQKLLTWNKYNTPKQQKTKEDIVPTYEEMPW